MYALRRCCGMKFSVLCSRGLLVAVLAVLVISLLWPATAGAHNVSKRDASFVESTSGAAIGPFLYLGAKHMVTGYDHLMFLVGVIFFLYKLKDILLYVSLFTLGHSVTLLAGVLGGIHANPYIIDAIIALSVVYKAFDNMDGFKRFLGFQPNTRAAVLIFGLFHGFGLATKLQELALSQERPGHQHRQFQRRRGDRTGAGADRHPDRAELLAHARQLPARCVCNQHGTDGGRIYPARLPTGGVLHTMMNTTTIVAESPSKTKAPEGDRACHGRRHGASLCRGAARRIRH